jgi:hypothetical protein
MDKIFAILLLVAELGGVVVIVQLWTHAPRPPLISRLLWSVILILPVFGLLFYIFLREVPEPHGENKWTSGASGWNE